MRRVKYSEDQPRDDRGRFGSGGGSGGHAAAVDLVPSTATNADGVIKLSMWQEATAVGTSQAVEFRGLDTDQAGILNAIMDEVTSNSGSDGAQLVAEFAEHRTTGELGTSYETNPDELLSKMYEATQEGLKAAGIPDEVTLYHGVDHDGIALHSGLMFMSTDRDFASAFAGAEGHVYAVTVPREAVIYTSLTDTTVHDFYQDTREFSPGLAHCDEWGVRASAVSGGVDTGPGQDPAKFGIDTSVNKARPTSADMVALLERMREGVVLPPKTGATVRRKFSEDEERDDHGRWTSGGGDGSTMDSAPTTAAERIAAAPDTAPPAHEGQNPCSPKVREIAEAYTDKAGITYDPEGRHGEYAPVDEKRAGEIALLYDAAKDEPNNPEVAAAYQAFKDETHAQYEFLREQGYTIKVNGQPGEPYPNSAAFEADVRDNHDLTIFPTTGPNGEIEGANPDNPLLEKTGETVLDTAGRPYEMTANDEFRWVHDIMGHTIEGNTTGPRGEENAWRQHSSTYSPEAARAMTTETRGQNSWVNFGPGNPGGDTPLSQRSFAPQKITLLPEWVSTLDGYPPSGKSGPPRGGVSYRVKYSEDQPRDDHGRFGSGGAVASVDDLSDLQSGNASSSAEPKLVGDLKPGDVVWGRSTDYAPLEHQTVVSVTHETEGRLAGWVRVETTGSTFTAQPTAAAAEVRDHPDWANDSKLAEASYFDVAGTYPPGGTDEEAKAWREGLSDDEQHVLTYWESSFDHVEAIRDNPEDPLAQKFTELVAASPATEEAVFRGVSDTVDWSERVGRDFRIGAPISGSTSESQAAAFGNTLMRIEDAPAHLLGNGMNETVIMPGRYEVTGVHEEQVSSEMNVIGLSGQTRETAYTVVDVRYTGEANWTGSGRPRLSPAKAAPPAGHDIRRFIANDAEFVWPEDESAAKGYADSAEFDLAVARSPLSQRSFAPQKITLLPEWVSTLDGYPPSGKSGPPRGGVSYRVKYSEDQPRDDHGRFGSGGGSAGEQAATEIRAAVNAELTRVVSARDVVTTPDGRVGIVESTTLDAHGDVYARVTMPYEPHSDNGVTPAALFPVSDLKPADVSAATPIVNEMGTTQNDRALLGNIVIEPSTGKAVGALSDAEVRGIERQVAAYTGDFHPGTYDPNGNVETKGELVVSSTGEVGYLMKYDKEGGTASIRLLDGRVLADTTNIQHTGTWETPVNSGFVAAGVTALGNAREVYMQTETANAVYASSANDGSGRTYAVEYPGGWENGVPAIAGMREALTGMVTDNHALEADAGVKNAWNGSLVYENQREGVLASKDWSCSVSIDLGILGDMKATDSSHWNPSDGEDARMVLIHELSHGLSDAGTAAYRDNVGLEEGVVDGYAKAYVAVETWGRDQAVSEGLPVPGANSSGYPIWVDALNLAHEQIMPGDGKGTYGQQLDYYRNLLTTPLPERQETLNTQVVPASGYQLTLTGQGVGTKMGYTESLVDADAWKLAHPGSTPAGPVTAPAPPKAAPRSSDGVLALIFDATTLDKARAALAAAQAWITRHPEDAYRVGFPCEALKMYITAHEEYRPGRERPVKSIGWRSYRVKDWNEDDHPRDDHGRFGSGGGSAGVPPEDRIAVDSGIASAPALAAAAYASLQTTGGATLDTTTNTQPATGISVASAGSQEDVFRSELVTPAVIEQYITEHAEQLAHGGNYLGVWEDHGYVHLDVSEVFDNPEDAAAAGRARGELAGYDLATHQDVPFDTGSGPDNPIVTGSVDIAARELAAGKYVDLNQAAGLSTLTDKLAEIAQQSQAAGTKAPLIDLGKVTIQGTNLFMNENLGVPRAEMPQFSGTPEPGSPADNEALFPKDSRGEVDLSAAYTEHLASLGVTVTDRPVDAANLRATQNELDGVKVAAQMDKIEAGTIDPLGRAIWTTRDDYVLDGHHSWAAAVGVEATDTSTDPINIATHTIDMSITDALRDAQDWTKSMGILPRAVGKRWYGARFKADVADEERDAHGRWTSGGGDAAAADTLADSSAADLHFTERGAASEKEKADFRSYLEANDYTMYHATSAANAETILKVGLLSEQDQGNAPLSDDELEAAEEEGPYAYDGVYLGSVERASLFGNTMIAIDMHGMEDRLDEFSGLGKYAMADETQALIAGSIPADRLSIVSESDVPETVVPGEREAPPTPAAHTEPGEVDPALYEQYAAAANSGDTVEQERLRHEIMVALGTAKVRGGMRVKYSEDQPRDDRGRFGSGGTGDDPTKGDPTGELPNTENVGRAFMAMNADRFDKSAQENQHPENYEPNGGYGVHLKEGGTEWRRSVDENGVPTIYQVVGKKWDDMTKEERMAVPGTDNILPMRSSSGVALAVAIVPGSEQPDPYVYRVMATGEFDQAQERGYYQTTGVDNLDIHEGTVASRGSTGSFYAPMDGSAYRVVQVSMDPADGWKVDHDGYVKTDSQVPFSASHAYSQVIPGEGDTSYRAAAHQTPKSVFDPIRSRGSVRVKYSEEEERDENGRWTSGGGGGTSPVPEGILAVPSDLSDLNAQSREAWVKDLGRYGVTVKDLETEIKSKIDQAAIDHATPWYPAAHDMVIDIAGKAGMPEDRVAAAMSAMSGRCEWMNKDTGEGEVKYLQSMAQYVADGKAEGKTTEEAVKDWKAEYKGNNTTLALVDGVRTGDPVGAKIMNSFAEKGMGVLTGDKSIEDTLPQNKQRSFYDNIMQPGVTREVTCDTHMFKVFENAYKVSLEDATKMSGHDVNSVKDGIAVNGTGYLALSEAVRNIADNYHTSPDVVQAAYWERVHPTPHIGTPGADWPSGLAATPPKPPKGGA